MVTPGKENKLTKTWIVHAGCRQDCLHIQPTLSSLFLSPSIGDAPQGAVGVQGTNTHEGGGRRSTQRRGESREGAAVGGCNGKGLTGGIKLRG